jgi:histidinol-phosphate phosphatase family protein
VNTAVRYDVVVPTSGRPSLGVLLATLGAADGPLPARVLLVDDRRANSPALDFRTPAALIGRVKVLRSGGRGPAAARNVGWRAATAPWVAFLDDDVIPPPGWRGDLVADLRDLPARVAGSQGRIRVPLPRDRRPTDWERNVAGLESACWATADLAYRRAALEALGGFDERFPRAYREDSDLGLRLAARGWEIVRGDRSVLHPVGTADRWVSVRKQAGNADDALMTTLHGRAWRERAGAPRGRFARHAAITATGLLSPVAAIAGARRTAAIAAALWAAGIAEFAWARIAPGPRTREELRTMLLTSAAIPPVATLARLRGMRRARRLAAAPRGAPRGPRRVRRSDARPSAAASPARRLGRGRRPDARPAGAPVPAAPRAVLLDRDGTLVRDIPYNGDPALVDPLPGVREALERLRAHGIRLAVVSNQSGIARGRLTASQAEAVMARANELLGPFDDVRWCPHGPEEGCACRKPAPGLLLAAAAALDVDPSRCAMIGDIGADVDAARAAGMRAVLVPTGVTRPEEVATAPETARTFAAAVDLLLRAA